jgi:hypothetical protein
LYPARFPCTPLPVRYAILPLGCHCNPGVSKLPVVKECTSTPQRQARSLTHRRRSCRNGRCDLSCGRSSQSRLRAARTCRSPSETRPRWRARSTALTHHRAVRCGGLRVRALHACTIHSPGMSKLMTCCTSGKSSLPGAFPDRHTHARAPPCKTRHVYTACILQGGVPNTHTPPCRVRHVYTVCTYRDVWKRSLARSPLRRHVRRNWPGRCQFAQTPVRFVVHPWIATVIQGSTGSFEGVRANRTRSLTHRVRPPGLTA